MNYRHAFHAGNFADVMKHAILARLVIYLARKDKAFRVIDTHAGIGRYDLSASEAQRTGEWRDGIGRLLEADLSLEAAVLLHPYLEPIRNQGSTLASYPGSPSVVRQLLRKQDRLTAIELHPQDADSLHQLFAGDFQTRVIHLDGWLALKSQLPPKEKRGLVLIDPPYEAEGEFERMVDGLMGAHKRWPGGIYALWYPLKNDRAVSRFRDMLVSSDVPDIIDIRLIMRTRSADPALDGSGLIVVNPPYTLESELGTMLPALTQVLAQDRGASWEVARLAPERLVGSE